MKNSFGFLSNVFCLLFVLVFFTDSSETSTIDYETNEKLDALKDQIIHSKQQFIAPIKAYLKIIDQKRKEFVNTRKKKNA